MNGFQKSTCKTNRLEFRHDKERSKMGAEIRQAATARTMSKHIQEFIQQIWLDISSYQHIAKIL